MAYLYETHLHTRQSSKCGVSDARHHVRYYKALGYTGIFVTDHFFGGNTAIPRNLPWEAWVQAYCKGYEDALEEGQKVGLDVFFGWEQGYGDDEYLVYGLDKQWLLEHPQMARCSRREQLLLVHEGGGCVIQAHPFRMRDYMRCVRLGLAYCDGIEAANGGNTPIQDAQALRYGQDLHLVMTAGSDNHQSPPLGASPQELFLGVLWEEKLTSARDYAQRLLRHEQPGLQVPQSRLVLPETADVPETYWVDDKEGLQPTGIRLGGHWV